MSATIDYLNAKADWRFAIEDVRGADGTPFDLSGFDVTAVFRPYVEPFTAIARCSSALGGGITVTPADPAATSPTGPTITIVAPAADRSWAPSRPVLVVADVMISTNGSEDPVRRLAFVAMPGT